MLNKYYQVLQVNWQNGLVYKTSLFLWRLRQFLSSVMALTLWTVIYQGQDTTLGYQQSEMITYIFMVSVLQSMVLATMLQGLAQRVYSGEISNILLKPINIFGYFFSQEIADKAKNLLFILIETVILYLIFRPELSFPSPLYALTFAIFTLGAIILHFFIQLIFGSLGFWSPETWGPRFLFFMFLQFTAGKLFPLDILPQIIQRVVYLTPFPYLSFVQIQVYLERVPINELWQHGLVLLIWLVVTGVVARWIWQQGMKDYAAAGQ